MSKRLSNRALVILCLIKECSYNCENHKELDLSDNGCFFVPSSYRQWVDEFKVPLQFSGAGDGKIINSLIAKGLARKPKSNLPIKYMAQITEEGVLAIEKARESGQIENIMAEVDRIKKNPHFTCY